MANPIHFVPGRLDAATRAIRPVVAVDLGFARERASCGLARCLAGDLIADYKTLQFSEVIKEVAETFGATANGVLILEAPLSGAFDGTHRLGNPAPRGDFERPNGQTRYWYCGAGAEICLGAIFFLWELRNVLVERGTDCTIHLFEGFVTAGDKSAPGDNQHTQEAKRLFDAFLAGETLINLTNSGGLRLVSLLQLLGWEKPNCEVPTIIKP
jgi:hypothetical protein